MVFRGRHLLWNLPWDWEWSFTPLTYTLIGLKVTTSAIKCPKYSTTSPNSFQHLLTLQEIISGMWAPSSMQSHHIKGLQIQLKTGYPFGTDVEYWIQNQEPFVPLREANCLVDVFFLLLLMNCACLSCFYFCCWCDLWLLHHVLT